MSGVRRLNIHPKIRMSELLTRTLSNGDLKHFYEEVKEVEMKTGKRMGLSLYYLTVFQRRVTAVLMKAQTQKLQQSAQ